MSEISLTLVVQKQVNKTPTDMAKIAQKNEKITAFGELNFVLDKFNTLLGDRPGIDEWHTGNDRSN